MKLTDPQRKALELIHANPGKVTNLGASHDNAKGHLTIHGNTSNNLVSGRLIEAYNPANGLSYDEDTDGTDISPWYSGTYRWRLTAAGREALGLDVMPERHPITGMTTHQLRDYLATTITDGRLERINNDELHDLVNTLQLRGDIADETLQELVDRAVRASEAPFLLDANGVAITVGEQVRQARGGGIPTFNPAAGAKARNAGRVGRVVGLGRTRLHIDFGMVEQGQPVIEHVRADAVIWHGHA